ncbi:MAG: hypothetical protein KUG82_07620 [Pseudomonadales bacterium]|nr:hypothetical protein [Pseudomonadales bacterium]
MTFTVINNLPADNQQWLKEVSDAILASVQIAEAEYGSLNTEAKQNLYKYAPMFVARYRKVHSKEEKVDMARYAAKLRARDAKLKPEMVSHYEINYMLSFLDSHVFLKLIGMDQHDEIMRVLIRDYEFFLDLDLS